jgi:hypothetical protein
MTGTLTDFIGFRQLDMVPVIVTILDDIAGVTTRLEDDKLIIKDMREMV